MNVKSGNRLAFLIAALLIALTCLPYLSGYSAQTEEEVFSGSIFNRPDYSVYFSSMHAGQQGDWRYRFQFTHENSDSGALTKMFYTFLGQMARLTGLSLVVVFHLARIGAGIFCCLSIYALSGYLFPESPERLLMYCFALWGAGLGWVQLNLGMIVDGFPMPLDYWLVDGYAYMGFLFFPHFAVVTGLQAGMLTLFLSHLHKPRPWKVGAAALAGILILLIQPFSVFLVDLALAGAGIGLWMSAKHFPWETLQAAGWIVLAQLPLLGYNAYLYTRDPTWSKYAGQNIATTPPWYYLLWGYFFLWPLALAGIPRFANWMRRGGNDRRPNTWIAEIAAMLAWGAGALALAYFPFSFQRRLLQAFSLPLAVLAVYGWTQGIRPWLNRRSVHPALLRSLPVCLVLISLIPPLFLMGGYSVFVRSRPEILYDSRAVTDALDWLAHAAGSNERVMASERTSLAVVERTGLPVYYGHALETLYYGDKSRRAAAFFAGESSGEDWLQEAHIRWVIYGPYERELGAGGSFQAFSDFVPVYQNNSVTIYRVLSTEPGQPNQGD